MITNQNIADSIQLTLLPNRSASWLASKRMIAFMVGVVLTIALGWLYVGVWMILPFAGLEVGLFATLMYLVSKQTYREQVVTLSNDAIVIEDRLGKRKSKRVLKRENSFVEVIETDRDWNLPRVFIVNDEQRILVGDFLNLQDRQELRALLQQSGMPTCRTHWWKSDK